MDNPITVVMTTYFMPGDAGKLRLQVAQHTLTSWIYYLIYTGGSINLHVADDGSAHSNLITDHIQTKLDAWGDVTYSRQERHGCGASLNRGFDQAFTGGSIALYAVDDWELLYPHDITPWVNLLEQDETVGMVRLGPPHPNLTGNIEMFPQGWGLRLNRRGFAYGMRPALYHKRFYDAYGRFGEDMSTLECERLYNERFASSIGPDIVLALPHPWNPLESGSLSGIDPRQDRENDNS